MGLEPAERGPGIFGMPRLDFTMYVIWVISLAIITKHTKILDKWSETDRETCDGSLEVLPQYRGGRLEQLTVFFAHVPFLATSSSLVEQTRML